MVEGISGSPVPTGLVDRVKAILLKPKEEWPRIAAALTARIDTEQATVFPLYEKLVVVGRDRDA